MSLRRPVAIAAAACLAAAATPAAALAASGGASPDVNPDGTTGAALAIGTPVATSSSGGITITSKGAALLKRRAVVSGVAPTRLETVSIEALDAKRGVWTAVGSGTVRDDGSFRAAWKPRALGAQSVRAVPGTSTGTSSRSTTSGPQVEVTVYRPGVASWYSPATNGGSKTACGVRLTQWTIGVAHKTLPCGTQVELYYGNKKLVVPVIDRGPFIDGRSWDLTKATHDAIGGKDGLITVGALTVTTVPKLKTPFQAPTVK